MNECSILLCSWPGLRRLWLKGDFRSLIEAVAFGGVLDLALTDIFVWPELMTTGSSKFIWLGLVIWWLAAFGWQIRGRWQTDSDADSESIAGDALFIQAQTEYLSGNWEQSQWLIEARLARQHRDVEARLLLATLHRHRRQYDRAREQLQILQRFDEATKWRHEIGRELELLKRFEEFNPTDELTTEADTVTVPEARETQSAVPQDRRAA